MLFNRAVFGDQRFADTRATIVDNEFDVLFASTAGTVLDPKWIRFLSPLPI